MWIGGRRLPPAAMFPAGDPRFRIHWPRTESGLTLRAVDVGPLDASRTVLCLHGWGCSAFSYRHVLPALADAGVRAIALDLPGHGQSDQPAEQHYYTLSALVGAASSAASALGIDRATVVGHSMGGPIAARVAIDAPALAHALVLLAPVGFNRPEHLTLASAGTPDWLTPLLPYVTPRWIAWLALHLSYGDGTPPSSEVLDQYWAPSRNPSFIRALRTLLHHFDWDAGTLGMLDGIACPTAVLYGEKDPLVPRADAARYLDVVPGARLEQIDGCGHAIADERPDVVTAAILGMVGC